MSTAETTVPENISSQETNNTLQVQKSAPNMGPAQSRHKRIVNYLVSIIFGLVIPVFLLVGAYGSASKLSNDIQMDPSLTPPNVMAAAKKVVTSPNDYVLLSWVYGEYANEKTMVNKQIMKVTIINIGLAVLSIGLMLIILGINDGGGELSAASGDFKFDFKTGSTGALILFLGSGMALAGGTMKNDFAVGELPVYEGTAHASMPSTSSTDIEFMKSCQKDHPQDVANCFTKLFQQYHRDSLR